MTTTKKAAAKKAPKTVKASAKSKPAPKANVAEIPTNIEIRIEDKKDAAKVKAYMTLKNADLPIPEDLALEVESLVAAARKLREDELVKLAGIRKTEEKEIAKANKEGPQYIRNGYPSEQFIRLERQEETKNKIKLSPRGQRGDLFPLQDGDLDDPSIKDGIRKGLIELIGNGDAQAIMAKQTENMQTQHVPIVTLRNSQGEAYEDQAVHLTAEYNQQGIVVAVENPNKGEQHENMKWTGTGGADGGLMRLGTDPEKVHQFIPTTGNPAIISSGFEGKGNRAAEEARDALARNKGGEGPEAALAGLTLTVEPARKT